MRTGFFCNVNHEIDVVGGSPSSCSSTFARSFSDDRDSFSPNAPTTTTTTTEKTFADDLSSFASPNSSSSAVVAESAVVENVVVPATVSVSPPPLPEEHSFAWYEWSVEKATQLLMSVSEHVVPDGPFAHAVVLTTIAVRAAMFPVFGRTQRHASRVAHMRPEMERLNEELRRSGRTDPEAQSRYQANIAALTAKYDCHPLKALLGPLAQMPVFVSLFLATRRLLELEPDLLADGGVAWFPDLTQPDPLYVLPVVCGATFVTTIELSRRHMAPGAPGGEAMIAFFRVMGVVSIPVMAQFPAVVLCYWTTNNAFTLVQSVLLRTTFVKRAFGIWDPPKPVPGQEETTNNKGFRDMLTEAVQKQVAMAEEEQRRLDKEEEEEKERQRKDARRRTDASVWSDGDDSATDVGNTSSDSNSSTTQTRRRVLRKRFKRR